MHGVMYVSGECPGPTDLSIPDISGSCLRLQDQEFEFVCQRRRYVTEHTIRSNVISPQPSRLVMALGLIDK
jgi:hypothetical protein